MRPFIINTELKSMESNGLHLHYADFDYYHNAWFINVEQQK